jgi:hypothetical protein
MSFSLGRVVATPGALAALERLQVNPLLLLGRHESHDWGSVDKEDWKANDDAVIHGTRIFSAYVFEGVKFWVITESDRSSTCLMLPSEY